MPETKQRAILHVDMDAFYASVEQYDNPELRGKPVIVGGAGNRGVVAAASYEVRAFGVRSAMPSRRARSLAPSAIFVKPRLDRYREVSGQVFDVFRRFTPLVEGLSLDEAFLDVTGSLKIFGTREDIGARVRDEIKADTGLQASVGMAHNKFLAKLASDAEKPSGFVSVPEGGVHAFLDPLPIGRLWGIGKKTEPKIRAQGILTIGQLRKADPAILNQLFGNRAGHYLALARGEDEREVNSDREDKSISHEITFDVDILDGRELRAELLRLSEAVMRRVRKQHLAARTIHIKIRDHRFRTVTRSLTLRHATNATRSLYQTANGLLDKWLREHGNTPVRLVGVGVSGFVEMDEAEAVATEIDSMADEIADRFGSDKLVRGLALERGSKKPGPGGG